MRVLSTAKDSSGTLTSATIEANKDQAIQLVNAASSATLYFGLIDASGYEYQEGMPTYPEK